jgi:aspartate 1-decarboxylase
MLTNLCVLSFILLCVTMRIMLKSKIHRATVTQAELNYVGSITIDSHLMDTVDLIPGEKVLVVNNTTGARFETYVLEGEWDSGVICINGGAAHLATEGDNVTIIAFEVTGDVRKPNKVLLDSRNKVIDIDMTILE